MAGEVSGYDGWSVEGSSGRAGFLALTAGTLGRNGSLPMQDTAVSTARSWQC